MYRFCDPPRRKPNTVYQLMPDGSGVVIDTASHIPHALNTTGAMVWELCDGRRTVQAIAEQLHEYFDAPLDEIVASVTAMLDHLSNLGVIEVVAPELPFRCWYDFLDYQVEVQTNSAEFAAILNRLNTEFLAEEHLQPDAVYQAIEHEDRAWELRVNGKSLEQQPDLIEAVSYLEWQISNRVVEWHSDLLHVHAAALANADTTVLLPGSGGIGKTTFAMALMLRGLRMLADDVVFFQPGLWLPLPYPRSFHLHDDAVPRLETLGLCYKPEERIGGYICSSIIAPWDRSPGPPVKYVILPRWDPQNELVLEPITKAEAVVELIGRSHNLRRFPRSGLQLLPSLLADVECYILKRNEDLGAAADLVYRLVTGEHHEQRTA